jgi:hypothetical protein
MAGIRGYCSTVPRSHPLVPVRTRHHAGTTRSGYNPSTRQEKRQLRSVPCTHPLVPARTRELPGTSSVPSRATQRYRAAQSPACTRSYPAPCRHHVLCFQTEHAPRERTTAVRAVHAPACTRWYPPTTRHRFVKKNPVRSLLSGRGGGEKDDLFAAALRLETPRTTKKSCRTARLLAGGQMENPSDETLVRPTRSEHHTFFRIGPLP